MSGPFPYLHTPSKNPRPIHREYKYTLLDTVFVVESLFY